MILKDWLKSINIELLLVSFFVCDVFLLLLGRRRSPYENELVLLDFVQDLLPLEVFKDVIEQFTINYLEIFVHQFVMELGADVKVVEAVQRNPK